MERDYCIMECHEKGKHLTYENRLFIEQKAREGWSANRIAKKLGCAPNTVRNEIKRGTVALYNGHVHRYKAKAGQKAYERNRKECHRKYELLDKIEFIEYALEQFYGQGWSLDVMQARAITQGGFRKEDTVCSKTLYNYVDMGFIDAIKNIDLPMKTRINAKSKRIKENKRILGESIENRPEIVDKRMRFGDWEIDLVVGKKSGDSVLLTLVERKTRYMRIIRIPDKRPESVMKALMGFMSEYGEHADEIFKTITSDNGLEFARLGEVKKSYGTDVYFAHPYSSFEKGCVERHNRMIRRFIPKGKRIEDYPIEYIMGIELWCNGLPRKILGYKTPDEMFEDELDKIYGMET